MELTIRFILLKIFVCSCKRQNIVLFLSSIQFFYEFCFFCLFNLSAYGYKIPGNYVYQFVFSFSLIPKCSMRRQWSCSGKHGVEEALCKQFICSIWRMESIPEYIISPIFAHLGIRGAKPTNGGIHNATRGSGVLKPCTKHNCELNIYKPSSSSEKMRLIFSLKKWSYHMPWGALSNLKHLHMCLQRLFGQMGDAHLDWVSSLVL